VRRETANVLVLDAGDAIAREGRESDKSGIQLAIAAEFLYQGMALTGCSAAAVGEGDLVFGDRFISQLAGQAGFPLLGGSVLSGSERAFPAIVIVPAGAARIGIASLLWDGFGTWVADHADPDRPLRLAGGREVLEDALAGLEGKADVKVLLAHAPFGELASLLEEVPGFDVAIAGHDSELVFAAEPRLIAGTRVVQVGPDGKAVGRLDLGLAPDGKLEEVRGSYVVLDAAWPAHPALADLHERYLDRVEAAIDSILEEYPVTAPPSGGSYVGAEPCKPCHLPEWSAWVQTNHFKAGQTLVDLKREYDPECFRCHTTGFGYEGGFRLITTTPALNEVGCEMCHTAGAEHCANTDLPYPKPEEATCRGCHQPVHSPEFDFTTYRTKILHLKG
jgi:hypothetical protein